LTQLIFESVPALPEIGRPSGNWRPDEPRYISRNAPVCPYLRHLVFSREASMLVDDIADRIAIACPDEIDGIVRDMWV
jgi:hypothetical protein